MRTPQSTDINARTHPHRELEIRHPVIHIPTHTHTHANTRVLTCSHNSAREITAPKIPAEKEKTQMD